MKRTKKMFAALMMAFVMLMTTIASNALVAKAETSAVESAKSSLVMVELAYEDAAGTLWPIQSGTGFLIDDEYVLTCYHVVNMDDDIKQQATDTIGVDFVNTVPSGLKVYIVVRRDMVIEASVVNGSEAADFTILKLSQSLNNRTYLTIGDSDNVTEIENLYALGYPSISDNFVDATVYTSEDVTITSGKLSKRTELNDIPILQHTATLSVTGGNSGGPLINENGEVVGINYNYTYESYEDENGTQITSYTYRAVAINEVVEYLDALGIPYVPANNTTSSEDDTTAAEPTTSEETTTTEEVTTTEEQTTTEEPVTTTAASDASDDEESGDNTILIIAIVAGVIVLVLIIVIIIVVVSGNKKKAARKKAAEEAMKRQQRPQQPPQRPQQGGYGPAPQPQRQVYTQNNATPNYGGAPADGAGETSVLNSGAGETTVLGSSAAATLRRLKDGQSVQITKQVFLIGKERRKVDFCISDNNSISRVHAQIVNKADGFYVVDQNSTNFTFVNGRRINPNQEVKLNNGDKIKFADEEFEFRL